MRTPAPCPGRSTRPACGSRKHRASVARLAAACRSPPASPFPSTRSSAPWEPEGWARSIARKRHAARARGRDQGPAGALRRRRGAPAAVRARGEDAGLAEPPERRRDPRYRPGRRHAASSRWSSCRGKTLAERIARGTAGPIGEAIDVCRQVAEGLEAAHEARRRPPRPETGQRAHHTRRRRQDPRLRSREAASVQDATRRRERATAESDSCPPDRRRPGARHADVHEPRAGARQASSTDARTSGPSAASSTNA